MTSISTHLKQIFTGSSNKGNPPSAASRTPSSHPHPNTTTRIQPVVVRNGPKGCWHPASRKPCQAWSLSCKNKPSITKQGNMFRNVMISCTKNLVTLLILKFLKKKENLSFGFGHLKYVSSTNSLHDLPFWLSQQTSFLAWHVIQRNTSWVHPKHRLSHGSHTHTTTRIIFFPLHIAFIEWRIWIQIWNPSNKSTIPQKKSWTNSQSAEN